MGGDQRAERDHAGRGGARSRALGPGASTSGDRPPGRAPGGGAHRRPPARRGCGRSSPLRRPVRPARHGAARALRAADHRPSLRRARRGPAGAGPRVPLGRAVSRDPRHPARGRAGRGGQELLLARRRRLRRPAARGGEGAGLRSVAASRRASQRDGRLAVKVVFPQGGSTLTQQLVRGYFLAASTKAEDANVLQRPTGSRARWPRCWACPPPTSCAARSRRCACRCGWRRSSGGATARRAAKEQILARYASFIYLGNGRYGFSAASEYYFDKPLSTYQQWDADKAALLAGIAKSPRDYAPTPPNLERPLRRRNDVLRLMAQARVHLAPDLAEHCARAAHHAGPSRSRSRRRRRRSSRTRWRSCRATPTGADAPAVRERPHPRAHRRSTTAIQAAVNEALEAACRLRAAASRRPGPDPGLGGGAANRTRACWRRPADAGSYNNRNTSYTDFNRAVESFRQPGSALKPIVYLTAFARGVRPRRTVRLRRADLGGHGPRPAAEVDRQLRRRVQGHHPHAPGAGRVAQLRDDVDHGARRAAPGAAHGARARHPLAAAAVPHDGARRVRGQPAGARRTCTARSRRASPPSRT